MHRIGHVPLTQPMLEKGGKPICSPHAVLLFLLRQGGKMRRKESYLQPPLCLPCLPEEPSQKMAGEGRSSPQPSCSFSPTLSSLPVSLFFLSLGLQGASSQQSAGSTGVTGQSNT